MKSFRALVIMTYYNIAIISKLYLIEYPKGTLVEVHIWQEFLRVLGPTSSYFAHLLLKNSKAVTSILWMMNKVHLGNDFKQIISHSSKAILESFNNNLPL